MIFKQMYSGGGEFVLNITSTVANPNIPALASAAGWNGRGLLKVNITAPLVNRIVLPNTWSFPSGLEIEISSGTRIGASSGLAAFTTQIPVSVRNIGIISGPGGGGGEGARTFFKYAGGYYNMGGGEGGGGQCFQNTTSLAVVGPFTGQPGLYFEYTGPLFGGDSKPYGYGGDGGAGGTWGSPGENGKYGTNFGGSFDSAGTEIAPTAGASAANSVIGNSFITWLATGTRLGPISA